MNLFNKSRLTKFTGKNTEKGTGKREFVKRESWLLLIIVDQKRIFSV